MGSASLATGREYPSCMRGGTSSGDFVRIGRARKPGLLLSNAVLALHSVVVMLRFLTFSRLVALALLFCIGQDLAGDLACDQTVAAPAGTAMTSTSTDGDGCQSLCVPDCFCCCRGVSADVSAFLIVDGQAAAAPSSPYRLQPTGVSGSVFRPPLHLA